MIMSVCSVVMERVEGMSGGGNMKWMWQSRKKQVIQWSKDEWWGEGKVCIVVDKEEKEIEREREGERERERERAREREREREEERERERA